MQDLELLQILETKNKEIKSLNKQLMIKDDIIELLRLEIELYKREIEKEPIIVDEKQLKLF